MSFFPSYARDFHVVGKATIECAVRADGALEGCVVLEETPVGWGFGAATVAAAQLFRMTPTVGGASVEGSRVRVPVRWAVDGLDNSWACAVFEAGRSGPDRKTRVAAFRAGLEAAGEGPLVARVRAKLLTDDAKRFGDENPDSVQALLEHCATAR